MSDIENMCDFGNVTTAIKIVINCKTCAALIYADSAYLVKSVPIVRDGTQTNTYDNLKIILKGKSVSN